MLFPNDRPVSLTSRQLPWSMTKKRKSLLLCALCANDLGCLLRENVALNGELARMTREQRRTKCRQRPCRGAEYLRSSHTVDSVGVERRVSPPPHHRAMLTFRRSLPDRMNQEIGTPEQRGGGHTCGPTNMQRYSAPSYAAVRASFPPIHHAHKRFVGVRRPKSLALTRQ
jgi:hypothetical protein